VTALANLRHDGQSERVSTRQFDPEMGPGVRTVRHATTTPVSEWRATPSHNGLWWAEGGGSIALLQLTLESCAHGSTPALWSIERMGEGVAEVMPLPVAWRFAPATWPALPAEPAPVARFAHPAQMFTPFSAPALEPMPDEPEDLP
jgi:hypothetical protein